LKQEESDTSVGQRRWGGERPSHETPLGKSRTLGEKAPSAEEISGAVIMGVRRDG